MLNSTVRQPLKFRPKCFISEKIKTTFADRSYDGKIQRKSHVKSTGIVLSSSATVYNNTGWIISSIDTYNLETGYTYNVFGETTQTRRELVDGRWMVSERVYDSQGRVVFSTDSHVEGSTDPIYGTQTIYDAQGRVEKTVRYVGCQVAVTADGTSTVVSYGNVLYQTSTEYDSKGRVKSSIDAYGNVTTYEYDNLDRQVAVNQETLGLRSETVYNKQGQVEKTVSNIKIEADKSFDYSDTIVSVNTYNMYGQVVKTVTDGRIVEYEYDDLGRQTAMIDHQTVDGVSHRTETVYDDLGRVVLSRTNVKQFADGTIDRSEAQEQQYVYDARGNVVKTIFADGTTISAAYNDQGQKVSETNQLGQTRHFEYDIKGRLIAVVLPAVVDPITNQMVSPRYEYQYDDFGRQTLLRDPNGYETRFTYDAFGNQATRTLPLGFGADGIQGTEDDDILPEGDFTEKSYYDDNGRLFMQISFEGVITTFSYDNYGRVHQKFFWESLTAYAEGTQPAMEVWTYTYDSQGRVTCVDQNGRKTETTYDLLGRVASIKTPEGTVSYEYDKFGRQTRVSSDKGDDVRYSYDIFGRLHTVTDATTGSVTTYDYDLVGTLARTTTDTGLALLVTQYQYDNMNRLIKLTHFRDDNRDGKMDSGEEISQFDYLLDAQGRKIQADEKFWVDSQVKNNKVNWTYDSAGRLIREVFDHYDDAFDQTSDWIYDLVGNRLQQTVNGNVTTYDYDVNDRLLYEIFGEKETFYGYDQTQQTSKVVTESGTLVSETTFEYDLQGRMAVVTTVKGNRTEIVKYEYGADGIRTSAANEVYVDGELVSKTRTEYLNDSRSLTGYSQVLHQTEYDADGNIIKETLYVIGHQRISQTVEIDGQKEQYFFTFDGHGSTRVLLDTALAVAQIYSFDAYGNALGFSPSEALTEFLYSGEQFDAKIGQQYLRARYYDPATGRFNRLDPFFGNMSDPQSFHKYLYTHADPVNGIDPSGLMFGGFGGFSFSTPARVHALAGGGTRVASSVATGGADAYIQYNSVVIGAGLGAITTVIVMNVSYQLKLALLSTSLAISGALSTETAIYASMLDNLAGTGDAIIAAASAAAVVASTAELLRQVLPPIYLVPELFTPEIYKNTVSALATWPAWYILTYAGRGVRNTAPMPMSTMPGFERDEFPYASTIQGGHSLPSPIVKLVPASENRTQSGLLGNFYTYNFPSGVMRPITGYNFLVVPVPIVPGN